MSACQFTSCTPQVGFAHTEGILGEQMDRRTESDACENTQIQIALSLDKKSI